VGITSSRSSLALFQGERVDLELDIRNHSGESIDSSQLYFLSYHLSDPQGKLLTFDNRRFPLSLTIPPGKSQSIRIPLFFSHAPGRYRVELDLVKEGSFWGKDKGWKTAWIDLELLSLLGQNFRDQFLPSRYETGDPLLDGEQHLLRLTLKNCERLGEDDFFAFQAGSTYPQSWIRDTATLMFLSRLYYPLADLSAILERFLANQSETGTIPDWVDDRGNTDKNTVETDQESSLVIAARWLALEDSAWLRKVVRGRTVLDRVDLALEWVWRQKRDPRSGLIISGFTADWGDVEKGYPDQRAVKWSDRSQRVVGIYTQAKYIQAVEAMVEMATAVPEPALLKKWHARLPFLREQTRKWLYLPEKGMYRIHRVVEGEDYTAIENDMLALGGNAEAMLAKLMTREEIGRFIASTEERRRRFGLNSVFYTLIPPYPKGFFAHPIMSEPWTYQNGGEWDWISGRYIQAVFRNGFRDQGLRYLRQIIEKHRRNGAVWEWEDRLGNGRGAAFYAGAAGVIGELIWRDYLGLGEDFKSIRLQPGTAGPVSMEIRNTRSDFSARLGDNPSLNLRRSVRTVSISH